MMAGFKRHVKVSQLVDRLTASLITIVKSESIAIIPIQIPVLENMVHHQMHLMLTCI